jgi:hypothetical protein
METGVRLLYFYDEFSRGKTKEVIGKKFKERVYERKRAGGGRQD